MENYLDFLFFFFMLRSTPVENTFVSIPSLSFFKTIYVRAPLCECLGRLYWIRDILSDSLLHLQSQPHNLSRNVEKENQDLYFILGLNREQFRKVSPHFYHMQGS